MHLHIDQYAHLNSPIHRWNPRFKFLSLLALMLAFSFVQDLRLVPVMLLVTVLIFAISRLPLTFLLHRMRYPGIFLAVLIVILPLFTGQTEIVQLGFLSVKSEGVAYMLLVVGRFLSILTVSLVLFGTSSFLTTVTTMRSLGIPALLTDILMLTVRYIFELADALTRMQRAMTLRGFTLSGLNQRGITQLARLLGSLFIRSYEQAERVYKAMALRGYGETRTTSDHPATESAETVPSTPEMIALELQDVHFAYPGRPATLDGVSLRIQQGERVGLIGPNGAGKTSLFLTSCGVHTPTAGTVLAYGHPVQPGKFHPKLGMVFQNADDQLFSPTVREDLAFGPVNVGLDEAVVAARVEAALDATRTTHLAERAPHHLSGGEKRMVAIASVLALQPGLVLYDEPDANLDMRARRRLIEFLQSAPHTVVLASHDLEMILEVCERVVLLDEGRIIADGDPNRIMADAALMEAHGLEKPHSLVPHPHPDGSAH